MSTYVLVHGAWHGGWCWGAVAKILRARGHTVFTPTQTGLGERRHLMSKTITLDTFVEDIVNVIHFEQLTDVVLVGHSFGGNAISGTADRMGERIRHLFYLDASMLQNGQRPFDLLPKDVVEQRIKLAEASGGVSVPAPPASAFGVNDPALQKMLEARLTPHPFSTFQSPLKLAHPVTNGRPATYIVCNDPIYGPLQAARDFVKANGIPTAEIATGHDAMVTAPQALADLIDR
jgi:pimeloyl-ACP methyl ester carboxylesterase